MVLSAGYPQSVLGLLDSIHLWIPLTPYLNYQRLDPTMAHRPPRALLKELAFKQKERDVAMYTRKAHYELQDLGPLAGSKGIVPENCITRAWIREGAKESPHAGSLLCMALRGDRHFRTPQLSFLVDKGYLPGARERQ